MHVAKGVANLLTHFSFIQLDVSASLPFQESSTGVVLEGLDYSCDQLLSLTLHAGGGHVFREMKTDRNTEATVANMIEGQARSSAHDVIGSKTVVADGVIAWLLCLFLHEACFAEACSTQARKRKRSSQRKQRSLSEERWEFQRIGEKIVFKARDLAGARGNEVGLGVVEGDIDHGAER